MPVQRFGEYVFPQITFPEPDQQTKLPREAPDGALIFYGQRSVTAAWATRSPWSISPNILA